MAYTPKENTGSLFRNDKGDNPARPDYRGDAMVNGELMEIAAWIKPLPSDESKRFMSLSFKPKEQRQEPKKSQGGGTSRQTRTDDDIPF